MSGIQQMLTGGTYKAPPPTTIGQAYGGGFYAGQISTAGTGVADYYLIVAPKSSGETSDSFGTFGVVTGFTSVINGSANSAGEASLGSDYHAALFCEGLSIGGYNDWYLPAKNELEVLYYFLKPTTDANNVQYGSNANAVSPEPINTNYSESSPAQTSVVAFQTGGAEALDGYLYFSSTERTSTNVWGQYFTTGNQNDSCDKRSVLSIRAVRKVPV